MYIWRLIPVLLMSQVAPMAVTVVFHKEAENLSKKKATSQPTIPVDI